MNLSLSVSLFHQLSLAQNCPLFQMEAYCRHHARHLVVNTQTSVDVLLFQRLLSTRWPIPTVSSRWDLGRNRANLYKK